MGIWSLLEEAARDHPEAVAVIDGERRFTYGELRERGAALATALRRRRVRPGDRVALLERNTHVHLEAYFGAAGAGAILVPLNTRLTAREITAVLRDSGARLLLAHSDFAGPVGEAIEAEGPVETVLWIGDGYEECLGSGASGQPFEPAPIEAGTPAHLYYTSGTTGKPKGVVLTHGNVVTHARWAVAELQLTPRDAWGHFAPLFHLADAWATFAVTIAGGRHVLVPSFSPPAVLAALEGERVTMTNLVPTMLSLLLADEGAAAADVTSLRLLLTGGAPIAPETVRRAVAAFGCDYAQTYGLTETSPYLTVSLLSPELRARSPEERFALICRTGRPFGGVELAVVSEAGLPVAADDREVGEVRARGPTVSPGYWKLPRETGEAYRDGWLLTGDLATLDEHGFLNIVDRKKDVIITGGENVYCTEVENVLFEHPAVVSAAVAGAPDELWGEVVGAAVVLEEGARVSEEELRSFAGEHLAAFKVPRRILFLAELPRTGSGKVVKGEVRRLLRPADL